MAPTSTLGRVLAAERGDLQPSQQAHPAQPGLLGIEDAPAVPELRYSLVGRLRRAAEVRVSADGFHAHLIVQCDQPPHAGHSRLPFAAVFHAEAGPGEVLALQALACRLGAGGLVLAVCRGLDFDAQRHELRAWRCDRITAIAPAEAARFLPDHVFDHPLDHALDLQPTHHQPEVHAA